MKQPLETHSLRLIYLVLRVMRRDMETMPPLRRAQATREALWLLHERGVPLDIHAFATLGNALDLEETFLLLILKMAKIISQLSRGPHQRGLIPASFLKDTSAQILSRPELVAAIDSVLLEVGLLSVEPTTESNPFAGFFEQGMS